MSLKSGLYFIRHCSTDAGCVIELDGFGRYRRVSYAAPTWASCSNLPQPEDRAEFFPVAFCKSSEPGTLTGPPSDAPSAIAMDDDNSIWRETARQADASTGYYRKILMEIGQALGVESFTSDDGSIQSEPLAAKIASLVVQREAERLAALYILNQAGAALEGNYVGRNAALESILPWHANLPRKLVNLSAARSSAVVKCQPVSAQPINDGS